MKIENHQSLPNYFMDLFTEHLFALCKYLHNQISETLMFPENTLHLLNYKTEIFQTPDYIYAKKYVLVDVLP